ncbi:MAG: primosomal protein N' [Coriobacteriales bacterium]|jgi:primosomal protein N' (replication factor Y)|nr:primosomal protein N' [Coriobacteriales bacterium]
MTQFEIFNEQPKHNGGYAQVVVDISTRAFHDAFTYFVPQDLTKEVQVGCMVLVEFAHRKVIGYVTAIGCKLPEDLIARKVRPIVACLSESYFSTKSAELASWLSYEYVAPLSDVVRLFTPPGSGVRLTRTDLGEWQVNRVGVKAADERWVCLTNAGKDFVPKRSATKQQAIIDALRIGEMRVAELSLAVSNAQATLNSLFKQGVVEIFCRRRLRGELPQLPATKDIITLTAGQRQALEAINAAQPEQDAYAAHALQAKAQPIFVLDGITGSGKTEVYLQAIRHVLQNGGGAIVLVPEISLTPQTVARFRSRFGEQVAVLHSRLSAGERLDQWDLLRSGSARVVVGARSALFSPIHNLKLIIIDEEHESSYKQGSQPRYTARDVAIKRAQLENAVLVLGSATPSMEALYGVQNNGWQILKLSERASGKPLPPVEIVSMEQEFKSGNTSMFSRALQVALRECINNGEKAVLLLNRRGFASFLLCRDCGYVPSCDSCSTSYTFHTSPNKLKCHHCGAEDNVPVVCPLCGSRYIKQLGPGTQFAYEQLQSLLPAATPIIRMDADSTSGKGGHERQLDAFIAAEYGVLLGTQMIAKGLDFPDVTLAAVLIADTTLKFPDFRAAERTYQLIEQLAGRAGRAQKNGRVIVQSYWPEHVAIRAAAAHDRELLLAEERSCRSELNYPPYARLANVLVWGEDYANVQKSIYDLRKLFFAALENLMLSSTATNNANAPMHGGAIKKEFMLRSAKNPERSKTLPIQIVGPSPCLISKRQGVFRWHLVLKAARHGCTGSVGGTGDIGCVDLPGFVASVLRGYKTLEGVNCAVDIDPYDMM